MLFILISAITNHIFNVHPASIARIMEQFPHYHVQPAYNFHTIMSIQLIHISKNNGIVSRERERERERERGIMREGKKQREIHN